MRWASPAAGAPSYQVLHRPGRPLHRARGGLQASWKSFRPSHRHRRDSTVGSFGPADTTFAPADSTPLQPRLGQSAFERGGGRDAGGHGPGTGRSPRAGAGTRGRSPAGQPSGGGGDGRGDRPPPRRGDHPRKWPPPSPVRSTRRRLLISEPSPSLRNPWGRRWRPPAGSWSGPGSEPPSGRSPKPRRFSRGENGTQVIPGAAEMTWHPDSGPDLAFAAAAAPQIDNPPQTEEVVP